MYCGSCLGERGCTGCKKALGTVEYTGLTEFFAGDESKEESGTGAADRLLLAADLGTTTLAVVCADGTGKVLASYGAENPQRRVAADVMGRIDAAIQGDGERLMVELREALVKGFLFVLEKVGIKEKELKEQKRNKRVRIGIAGNTTMQHFLLGYPVEGLAKEPFQPYSVEMRKLPVRELFGETEGFWQLPALVREAEIVVFPCFSAFVGGDVAVGAYGLFPFEDELKRAQACSLLMDFGTNGELLLLANGKLYGTSAAMGCAFEGGRFAYASDLFALIAKALREGAMDETGLLEEPYFTEGYFDLCQEDVRNFQLAKGAIRAATELLLSRGGVTPEAVKKVFLAGSVGRYCNIEDMIKTGLLPWEFTDKIVLVGNSCIGGILHFLRKEDAVLRTEGIVFNPANEPKFSDLFYRYMSFE